MNTAAIRHDTDWIGQVVDGKFTLIQWLGNSGHGEVFLTELPGDLPQKAAIKLVPANAPSAESQMAGWSEVKRLSHPHLMRLFHVGQCQIRGTKLFLRSNGIRRGESIANPSRAASHAHRDKGDA